MGCIIGGGGCPEWNGPTFGARESARNHENRAAPDCNRGRVIRREARIVYEANPKSGRSTTGGGGGAGAGGVRT